MKSSSNVIKGKVSANIQDEEDGEDKYVVLDSMITQAACGKS